MPQVDLTDDQIESLLEPFSETRVLDVDEDVYAAIKKLKDALAGNALNEELWTPGMDSTGDPDIWFLDLIREEEPLPVPDDVPLQAIVVQHAQTAMSKLNESMRHSHDNNRQRVVKDAAVVGLFAREICRAVMDADEWPIPRPE